MRQTLIAASIAVCLSIPSTSQAFSLNPIKGLKKIAHVAEQSLLVTGMIVGAIAFCSTGACN